MLVVVTCDIVLVIIKQQLSFVVFILCTLSAKAVTYYRALFHRLENRVYIMNLLSIRTTLEQICSKTVKT